MQAWLITIGTNKLVVALSTQNLKSMNIIQQQPSGGTILNALATIIKEILRILHRVKYQVLLTLDRSKYEKPN